MGGAVSLIIDILMAILMVVTIIHCVRLSRRLTALRESRAEMDATIKQFFEASAKADLAIRSFQRNASETAQKLDGEMVKTRLLIDELKIMIETGNNLAGRLEGSVDQARQGTPPVQLPSMSLDKPAAVWQEENQSRRQSSAATPARVVSPATAPDISSQEGEDAASGSDRGGRRSDGRTKAEQELLKALQNMR